MKSLRRHHERRIKEKIKNNFSDWNLSEKDIGKQAQVHGKGCSCYACGNPRKHRNEKTLGELKNEQPE